MHSQRYASVLDSFQHLAATFFYDYCFSLRFTQRLQDAAVKTLQSLSQYSNAQSHPRIALYRDALKKAVNLSAKKYPQSNESLAKRLLKEQKALRSINPIVDFYNAVSIKYGVTVGAFDLNELKRLASDGHIHLELRRSKMGDTFLALDAPEGAKAVMTEEGEISYVQGCTVLTRHLAWRQSLQGLVTGETRDVIFMSEVFNDEAIAQPTQLTENVLEELKKGLKEFFGVGCNTVVLGDSIGKLSADL
jgi:DNA/RNA-binding domain of Phe-tRNA-synthetase-like protein